MDNVKVALENRGGGTLTAMERNKIYLDRRRWRDFTDGQAFGLSVTRYKVEMCMGMGFPMGPGIPWESHGNGNKTQNWEWEWEGMGNHLSGNGNYLHSHGNLFPKVLCCDELIKLLVLYLPAANNKWLGFLLLGTYYNYYRITNYIQL